MNETQGTDYAALLALQTVDRITRSVDLTPEARWNLLATIRAELRNCLDGIVRTVEVTRSGSN